MQGLAWLFPLLQRPEDQRAVQRFNINPTVAEPALTTALPAGRQAVPQGQHGLPAVETDGLAEQQPGHHLCQKHQMTLIGKGAVLTEEADQLTMEPGMGCHRDLVWFRSPTLSWLPAHPMT